MARKKRKAAKPNGIVDQYLRPTEQREAHNDFRNSGMARKMVPVIDTLFDAGKLSHDEWERLSYYRDQASLADRSPLKSCIDFSPGGGDHGPGVAIMSAEIETWRMERDMGGLWHLARAVAVDDTSLPQWCIRKHGGRERLDGDGQLVAIVPVREKAVTQLALLELRAAAGFITFGIDARRKI